MSENPNKDIKSAQAPKKENYKVWDTTARDGEERTHEVINKKYDDGREPDVIRYRLRSDKPLEMSAEHAMRFLIDPAFRVERANGERIAPPPKYDPSLPLSIGLDQTIANFDELTKSALFKRVKVLAGSEDITIASGNQEMISFLTEHRRKQLQGNLSNAERELLEKMQGGELAGQASQESLKKMMPDSPLVAA